MPLSGLIAVSGHTKAATPPLVGGIQLRVVPGVNEKVGNVFGGVHVAFVAVLLLAIVIHVSAALEH